MERATRRTHIALAVAFALSPALARADITRADPDPDLVPAHCLPFWPILGEVDNEPRTTTAR